MQCYTSLVAAAQKMEYFPVQDPGEKGLLLQNTSRLWSALLMHIRCTLEICMK